MIIEEGHVRVPLMRPGFLAAGTDDGNFWVTEYGNGTVVRMTPAGQVLQRFPVGTNPTSVSTGPGGRVEIGKLHQTA